MPHYFSQLNVTEDVSENQPRMNFKGLIDLKLTLVKFTKGYTGVSLPVHYPLL